MKLIDLVNLSGSRLFDANWLNRLSLKRGRDCFCLLLTNDIQLVVQTRQKQVTLQNNASLVLSPEDIFFINLQINGENAFIGAIFFEVGPQDPLHAVAKRFSCIPGKEPHNGALTFFTDINAYFMSENIFLLRSARHQTVAFIYTLVGEQAHREQEGSHTYVEKALSFMHMHSDRALTLGDICRHLNLSEAYFVRLFKQEMQIPPMKYFMRMKIHNASLLLLQGMMIKEAADRLGFYSDSHFSKQFKQYMGIPPTAYKRNDFVNVPLHSDNSETILLAGAMLSYFDSISDMVFIKDSSFIYRGCNTAFCNYIGKKREEIFGHTDFTLFPKKTAKFYRLRDERIFLERKTVNNREWISYPDGTRIQVEASKSPYFAPSGELLGLIGISRPLSKPE